MQLSKKQKVFSQLFAAFLKSTTKFQHFEKKDELHSLCNSEEVYNRYFWLTFITCNFQINKKVYLQTLKFLPIPLNISMTPIHTKK